MLSPKEKIELIELQEKEKEPHIALTNSEIEEFEKRAAQHFQSQCGHLIGFTDLMSSIGNWTKSVAVDNARLIQEIHFLKLELETEKQNQISLVMQTVFESSEKAAEQSVQPTPESGRKLPAKKSNRKGFVSAKSG